MNDSNALEHISQPVEILPTVLVPGWLDTVRTLRPLAAYLERNGQQPVICSPQPSDGRVPIEALARQLAEFLDDRFGPEAPLNYFGFSMGGLIGRVYLQRMDGWRRIQNFVTVATPHRGTSAARFIARPATRQMLTGSDFLRELNRDLTPLARVCFTSIWTPFDMSILPATHCLLPVGSMRRVLSPAHGLLVYDPRIMRAVLESLDGHAG